MLALKDRFSLLGEMLTFKGTLYGPVVCRDATVEVSRTALPWGPQPTGYINASATESQWLKATPIPQSKGLYSIARRTHVGADSALYAAANESRVVSVYNASKPQTFDAAAFRSSTREERQYEMRKFMADRETFTRIAVYKIMQAFVRDAAKDGFQLAPDQPFKLLQAYRPEPRGPVQTLGL